MTPQLDLKRLKRLMMLCFFLGMLVSPLLAPLAIGIYSTVYGAFHISTYTQSETFNQALFALILGVGLILYWIIISLYEKDPFIRVTRGKIHFPAISPWVNGAGIILWGCFSLIRVAWHVPVTWPDPAFIIVLGLFFPVPWGIDLYRRRQRIRK